ncbi:uncharacterized protein J3D65DRAFT_229166 [Phyllosticta citribraziliensis]|uniref:Uncharacterized protein n=1 Tax=Phyllosticta citribraziliensis TaxID=989973 RepID=A0ABR1M8F8_9PEZI
MRSGLLFRPRSSQGPRRAKSQVGRLSRVKPRAAQRTPLIQKTHATAAPSLTSPAPPPYTPACPPLDHDDKTRRRHQQLPLPPSFLPSSPPQSTQLVHLHHPVSSSFPPARPLHTFQSVIVAHIPPFRCTCKPRDFPDDPYSQSVCGPICHRRIQIQTRKPRLTHPERPSPRPTTEQPSRHQPSRLPTLYKPSTRRPLDVQGPSPATLFQHASNFLEIASHD